MADYNIAMGVKPPEPINYLGQAAQMMALRAAQDDLQGNEAVKQFYAQGGDLSTPEARARLKSLNPKFGMAAEKAQFDQEHVKATTQKARNDSLKEAIALSVAGLANIGDVDSYRAWSLAHHDPKLNPELSSYFSRIGSTPGKAQARIDEMVAKYGPAEGLQRLKNESMGAVPQLFTHINQSADNKATNAQSDINNRRTVGVTARGQDLTRTTAAENLAFQKAKGHIIAGEDGFINFDPYGNARRVGSYDTQFGPNAPVDQQSAGVLRNNMAGAAGAGAPVNAMLTGGQPPQAPAAGPTVAAANAAAAQQNVPRPANARGLTEVQAKSTGFANRAAQAHSIINIVGANGEIQPGLLKRSLEAVPLIGEGLGTMANITQSDAEQQVEQAQRNFVNAVLRQESGAAVNQSEFDNARKQYFPQPGDGPKVIEQKKQNREMAIKSLEIAAGPGMRKTKGGAADDPLGLR